MHGKLSLLVIFLVFVLAFFSVVEDVDAASGGSFFERLVRGVLDALFPLSGPQFAPLPNITCAEAGGYCAPACAPGDYHQSSYDSSCLDDIHPSGSVTLKGITGMAVGDICCIPKTPIVNCVDADGDGYNITGGLCGEIDCNDSNVNVWHLYDMYIDIDGDQHGVGEIITQYCYGTPDLTFIGIRAANHWSLVNDDCDDNASYNFPGNAEVCDVLDNNCDFEIDDGLTCNCYINSDCDDEEECSNDLCLPNVGGNFCYYWNSSDGTACGIGGTCQSGVCTGSSGCVDGQTQSCGAGLCSGQQTCANGEWGDCDSSGINPEACAVCDVNGNEVYDSTYTEMCDSYCGAWQNLTRYYQTCTGIGQCSVTYSEENCGLNWDSYNYCNVTTGNIENYREVWSCSPDACLYANTTISLVNDCTQTCTENPTGVISFLPCTGFTNQSCNFDYRINSCTGLNNESILIFGCDGNVIINTTTNCDVNSSILCSFNQENLIQYVEDYNCDNPTLYDPICSYDSAIETGLTESCSLSNECDINILDCNTESYTCFFSNAGSYLWRASGVVLDSEASCDDGHDNDCDSFVDCDDSDCSLDPVCQVTSCSQISDLSSCSNSAGCEWCYECENNIGPASLANGGNYCVDQGNCGDYICDANTVCNVQAQCSVGEIETIVSCIDSDTALSTNYSCIASCSMFADPSTVTIPCINGEYCVDNFGCISDGLDYYTHPVTVPGWNPFAMPMVNLTNNDPSIFNADILITYDNESGWLINYNSIHQIGQIEPAKGYLAYYSSPRNISLVGNFDQDYVYNLDLDSWNLVGVMRQDTIANIYGDPTFTVYGWNSNEDLIDLTGTILDVGVAYWVYPGTPLEAPPSFSFWGNLLKLFRSR